MEFPMRLSFLRWCCLLITPYLCAVDPVKDFAQDLSKKQKTLLNDFLSTLAESSAGYVLYGDKPMSIEICDSPTLRFLSSPNARTIALVKGKEMWEDMKLSQENKEYVLIVSEQETSSHFVCINRKNFLQTVRDNIALFQYVLGPLVTPENLLNELINSKHRFYQVLQNDPVLLEILLGHGRQNAIVHSRIQDLSNLYSFGRQDEFPYISKKLSRSWAASSNKYQKKPSFGFSSIADEEFFLSKLTVSSEKLKPLTPCELPNFECQPDSEETKSLLNTYEQNRGKVLKALSKKDFFEETLRKFFTTTFQTVEIPSLPKERELYLPNNKEEMVSKVVEIINKKIEMEPYAAKKFQNAFLQGVIAREKGKQMPVSPNMKRPNNIHALERELECCKNLERANAYFNRLAAREDLVALVPNEIYFKVLKTGKGDPSSSKMKSVSFQYTFQVLGDNDSKDWGVVKNENISALLPGIAYALIGMQQGEERVVYIHPKYAYGEETFYPPNVSIVAQIRLLEFTEGEQGIAIFPAHQLEKRDYKDLLSKFEVLRGEEFFDEGVEFWDSIKKSDNYLDFQTFQKAFTGYMNSANTTSLNVPQSERFIVDLEYHLFSLQKAS